MRAGPEESARRAKLTPEERAEAYERRKQYCRDRYKRMRAEGTLKPRKRGSQRKSEAAEVDLEPQTKAHRPMDESRKIFLKDAIVFCTFVISSCFSGAFGALVVCSRSAIAFCTLGRGSRVAFAIYFYSPQETMGKLREQGFCNKQAFGMAQSAWARQKARSNQSWCHVAWFGHAFIPCSAVGRLAAREAERLSLKNSDGEEMWRLERVVATRQARDQDGDFEPDATPGRSIKAEPPSSPSSSSSSGKRVRFRSKTTHKGKKWRTARRLAFESCEAGGVEADAKAPVYEGCKAEDALMPPLHDEGPPSGTPEQAGNSPSVDTEELTIGGLD